MELRDQVRKNRERKLRRKSPLRVLLVIGMFVLIFLGFRRSDA